jgi:membrane-bound lytic murein transglycosylase MltF
MERGTGPFAAPLVFRLVLVAAILLAAGCEGDSAKTARSDSAEASGPGEPADAGRADEAPPIDPLAGLAVAPLARHVGERYPASLANVVEKRFLRVLTSRNAFDFFLYDGRRGGYQYEMVRSFTRFLNERHAGPPGTPPIQFELIPVHDDQLIPLLLEGAGDLIAARLTKTPGRAERVRFSSAYRTVDELLVTHDEAPEVESIEDLSGQTVSVRRSSSYHASLVRLNERLSKAGRPPVRIDLVDETLETERILELVAARRLSFTVADSLVAELAIRIHPHLRIVDGVVLRRNGELAWATLPSAEGLVEEMNRFLAHYEEGSLLGNLAVQKYFETEGRLAKRFAEGDQSRISDFDAIFREQAGRFGLDWRLVAAMAYQESRFDPAAHNRWGAIGLLQVKPKTAREPYVDIPEIEGPANADNNVQAGLKYLNWIKGRYFDPIPGMREQDRIRMALAAYNAGPRTLARARSRARKLGLDPDRWFRHVEQALLEMRKAEPVKYVSEINQRYLAYVQLGVE